MKIHQLLSGLGLYLSQEEKQFSDKHQSVKLNSLNEHEKWIAQNLVRKGAFTISNDNNTLEKALNDADN